MRIAFTPWRSGGLLNRPSPRKRLLPKKRTSSGFEFVSGLAAGASAMPAKWSRRVFSFKFYEGKISVPVTLTPPENQSGPSKAEPAGRHPGVLRKSQRFVQMWVVEDVPELIYGFAISPRLI